MCRWWFQQARPKRAERAIRTPVRGLVVQPGASLTLDAASRYLINPGSVGQPRDGNPDAAFGVYDAGRNRYTQYRVPYPVAEAQRKIAPTAYPKRLPSDWPSAAEPTQRERKSTSTLGLLPWAPRP